MELSCSRYSLKFKRPTSEDQVVVSTPVKTVAKKAEAAEPVAQSASEDLQTINSPIVGTFYLTPAPDAPPYVKVGSQVKQGDVVCTIEAMKLMNQLETEYDCEIVEILAKPEALVEFGQPLFKVKKL